MGSSGTPGLDMTLKDEMRLVASMTSRSLTICGVGCETDKLKIMSAHEIYLIGAYVYVPVVCQLHITSVYVPRICIVIKLS